MTSVIFGINNSRELDASSICSLPFSRNVNIVPHFSYFVAVEAMPALALFELEYETVRTIGCG
jgi:hypothetical protein